VIEAAPPIDEDGDASAFLAGGLPAPHELTAIPRSEIDDARRRHHEPHPVRTNRGPRGGA
jgi:hypothetical protein